MIGSAEIAPFPSLPDAVAFQRKELSIILGLYGRMVAAGLWRDYGISMLRDVAVFSIFRHTAEHPLYRIEKRPRLAGRQGQYAVDRHGRPHPQARLRPRPGAAGAGEEADPRGVSRPARTSNKGPVSRPGLVPTSSGAALLRGQQRRLLRGDPRRAGRLDLQRDLAVLRP